ncbi:chalcone synthase-like isoform X2 [Juglans regia]|uniref:Chalcone synthase-like isoform X2 n=1 Tax=Juglans regia TaxID=51240 RepID=A0A6P9EHA9_JUGRE|nr:chalcone synthase-like isoform X2 [Juglans regia]
MIKFKVSPFVSTDIWIYIYQKKDVICNHSGFPKIELYPLYSYWCKWTPMALSAPRHGQPAQVLAIGTANPVNSIDQKDFPDFYLRVTKSEHMTELKEQLKFICEESSIRKRHLLLTEEILANPNIGGSEFRSLNALQAMGAPEVIKLGKEAATKAIKEWGQPISKITHLVFCTRFGWDVPSPAYQLTELLGLNTSVETYMIDEHCHAGGIGLRLAMYIAERNATARILVVYSENTAVLFEGPSDDQTDVQKLNTYAHCADGAAAAIIGACPDTWTENPLFELVVACKSVLPDSEGALASFLREMRQSFYLSENYMPILDGNNMEKSLVDAQIWAERLRQTGISDLNSLFYVVNTGLGRLLDNFEENLGLSDGKLRASWHVLREYGYVMGPGLLFVLDEMRNKSMKEGETTTGHGLEWGVLFGFGPDHELETFVVRSIPIIPNPFVGAVNFLLKWFATKLMW